MYRQVGDVAGQGHVHLGLASLFDQRQSAAEAVRHADRALGLYQEAGQRSGQAAAEEFRARLRESAELSPAQRATRAVRRVSVLSSGSPWRAR